jgi:hypothetical protein
MELVKRPYKLDSSESTDILKDIQSEYGDVLRACLREKQAKSEKSSTRGVKTVHQ